MRRSQISSVTLFFLVHVSVSSATQTCSDCLQSQGLEWCSNINVPNTSVFSRCATNANNLDEWKEWCGEEHVYLPSNDVTLIQNKPFTDPTTVTNGQDQIIQIKPQRVQMKLTPGKTQSLDVSFKYARGYALELYYLMDMSKSMEGDKATIVRLADDLAKELKKVTPDLKFGFGSFIDKVMLPFVNTHPSSLENPCYEGAERTCRTPYGYQNILSLTNDTDEFIESVSSAKLSTNWDDPEGGLDALIQAMVCSDIGWKKSATRHLIVYVSESAFKYAGDGKLAGLTKQNDLQCHLDSSGMYTYSSLQDYPSVSQIESVSKDKRMFVIFAVKEKVLPLYDALTRLVVQSEASELREDSSNIIDIITSIYEDISRTLILTDDSYKSPDVDLTYSSKCGIDQRWQEGSSQCEDVDINEEIQFRINFKLKKCMEENQTATIKIFPQGLEDELIVKVSSKCDCDCESFLNSLSHARECNLNGDFSCGVCSCDEGFSGEHCECEEESDAIAASTLSTCKRPEDPSGRDCSGHGVCRCGVCDCRRGVEGNPSWMYQGNYCECSNFDCPKTSGALCNNHGICECNACVCQFGWEGEACECDTRQNNCINTVNNKMCSGNGDCICNQCKCHSLENDKTQKYFGKFCEDCQTCEGRCSVYNDCIQCKIYETGPILESCDRKCSALEIIQVDEIDETETGKRCSYKNEEQCLVISAYDPTDANIVYVQREPNCSEKFRFYVVIGGMIALILLIGLLLLFIWKCWVTIKDKREYHKFMEEYEKANYHHQLNPIYLDPVTRVTNPMRGTE